MDEIQPAQEPMATVTATVTSETGNPDVTMSWWHEPALPVGTKLYTTPPQRPWVGLTDAERIELSEDIWGSELDYKHDKEIEFARAVEQRLKEKNT